MSVSSTSLWSTAGITSCQNQILGRDLRAEIANLGPMSRWVSFEPGAGESVGEWSGFSRKRREIFLVSGIETQRQIRGQHGRNMLLDAS